MAKAANADRCGGTGWLRTAAGPALAAAFLLGLGACSTVESIDPTGLLGDDGDAQPATVEAPPEDASDYPRLSSVEEEPPRRPSGRDERQALKSTLAGDRDNARYTGDDLRGDGVAAGRAATDSEPAQSEPAQPEPAQTQALGDGGQDRDGETGGAGDSDAPEPAAVQAVEVAGSGAEDEASAAAGDTGRQEADAGGARETGGMADDTSRSSGDAGTSTRTADAGAEGASEADAAVDRRDIPQIRPSQRGEPVQIPSAVSDKSRTNGRARGADAGRRAQVTTVGGDAGERGAAVPGSQMSGRAASGAGSAGAIGPDGRVAVIYFRHGSHRLGERDRHVLRQVTALHREWNGQVRVVGHASSRTATLDPIAHRVANLDVSLKRAEAVADALVAMGVPRSDIRVAARADQEPVYHEFMATGEAGNRRAEVYLER